MRRASSLASNRHLMRKPRGKGNASTKVAVKCFCTQVIAERLYSNLSGYTEIKLYRTCRQVFLTNETRRNWWIDMDHTIQLACATTSNIQPASAPMAISQTGSANHNPTSSNMSRRKGSHWFGFSAFQLRCERQQWTILADEKDTHPFVIDDTNNPKLPDWLRTTRWGDWGYSTWCQNMEAALREASNSKSRGWRRVNGMDYNQLQYAWWIVLEMILPADYACDLLNRSKITCNVERKGIPTWRISEDIHIPTLRLNGGLVQKHVVYGWGTPFDTTVFKDFDRFTPGLTIFTGTCNSCKENGPLCAQQCAKCCNSSIPPPPPPEVLAIEDKATSSRNKIS